MARLSSLLTLCVSISSCMVDAATISTSCTGKTSSVKSVSSPSVNVNAPSGSASISVSKSSPSASGTASSSKSSPSAVGTASASISKSTVASSISRQTAIASSSRASSSRASSSGVSSSRASSSRPTSSLTPSSATSSNTCPPYSTSTRTKTTLVIGPSSTVNRGTITVTNTVYTSTVTYTATDSSTYTTTEYSSTSYITSTLTSTTSIVVIPASYTTTVPTPANFTPLLCLPDYLDPTVTVTSTSYYVTTTWDAVVTASSTFSTDTTVPFGVGPATVTISSPGVYTTTQTDYTQTVATRNDPTSTVYAACATNNVSPKGPYKGNATYNFIYDTEDAQKTLNATTVAVTDDVDCCAQCQANPSCVFSLSYVFFFNPGQLTCVLYNKPSNATATCSPTAFTGSVQSFPNETPGYYLSNGPCGQVDYVDSPFVFPGS